MVAPLPPGEGWHERAPGEDAPLGTMAMYSSEHQRWYVRDGPDPPSPHADIAALRDGLVAAGFTPVEVENARFDDPTSGKAPIRRGWQNGGPLGPPVAEALNTGVLCAGLRAIDLDIDNPTVAARCQAIAEDVFGVTLRRFRVGSPRCLLLYRAMTGAPHKIALAGKLGKIEVLGAGQQFVCFGIHWSRAILEWEPHPPGVEVKDDLIPINEADVATFLQRCAPIIDAKWEQRTNGVDRDHTPNPDAMARDQLKLASALADIPNDGPPNWDDWARVAMAIWAATGGDAFGWELMWRWSSRNPAFREAETRSKWDRVCKSPPNRITAGTIYHLAQEARDARTRAAEADRFPGSGDPPDPAPGDPGFQPEARAKPRPQSRVGRILTGSEFMAGHKPPVWLIKGLIQRGRLYSCTSLTGHGKTAVWLYNSCMISAGRPIGNRRTFQGNTLILSGENPTDLEARMIGQARASNLRASQLPFVLPGSFPMTEDEIEALKREIAGLGVPLALIVGDTASSFFPGEDENNNVQAGAYTRSLRAFSECDGNPAVVMLTHPVKNAAKDNLLPRGGGATLNEVDGNLTLWSQARGEVTEMHWHGKIRGADFPPFGYRLRSVPTGMLDEDHEPEITIIAEPMSEEAIADHGKQTFADENAVLKCLHEHPDWSWATIARHIGWVNDEGEPLKPKVGRAIAALDRDKVITRPRERAPWELTPKGEKALGLKKGGE